jgi:hypothetical protein
LGKYGHVKAIGHHENTRIPPHWPAIVVMQAIDLHGTDHGLRR